MAARGQGLWTRVWRALGLVGDVEMDRRREPGRERTPESRQNWESEAAKELNLFEFYIFFI